MDFITCFIKQLLLPAVFLAFTINAGASENILDKAIAEYKSENYEEAIELLKESRKQQPDSSLVIYYLGLAHKQTGDAEEAARDFKDAVKLTPLIPEAYMELIEVLYSLNELNQAEEWIKAAEDKKINVPRILFLKGLIYSKQGKNKDALAAFKAAGESDPSLRQEADFQIALIYAKEMKISEARESLKAVIAVNPASPIAGFAREYESAIKGLESYRTWRFLAYVAYQYDDNVVLKPSEAIPGVIISGEQDSGITGVFRIDYAPLLNDNWFFNGQFNLYTNTHFSTHSHDLIAPTVTLSPGYNFKAGAVSLPIIYSYSWLDNEEYESVFSVSPTFSRIFSPGHIGQFSAGYARRELLQSTLDDDENRDGDVYLASAAYIHPFSGDKGVFNVRYELSRDSTDGKNWENTGNRINVNLLAPLKDKFSLALAGEAFLQDYDNTHTIFGVKREDRTYYGSASIIWEVRKALNLSLQYSHTRADSNVSIYDYSRNIYTAAIEYRF